jgi:DNA-directed RNA polymerase subunit K/omega
VVQRPFASNAFEFAVVSGLRARQLAQGCTPRVPRAGKIAVTAQMEVAAGQVVRDPLEPVASQARALGGVIGAVAEEA